VTDKNNQEYYKAGYTVIKNFIDNKTIEYIKQQFTNIWINRIKNKSIEQNPQSPVSSLFPTYYQAHHSQSSIYDFLMNPNIWNKVEEIIGSEALVVSTTCFYKAPGTKEMQPHQDLYGFGPSGGQSCAVWLSIDQTDEENGGLYVIPGTHRLGLVNLPKSVKDISLPPGYSIVRLNTSPGDLVILHPLVIHGSFENRSKARFRRVFFSFFTSCNIDSIFQSPDQLTDRNGNMVKRKLNKLHMLTRDNLFREPLWGREGNG